MIPKFRVWHKQFKLMKRVRRLDLDYDRVFVAIDSSKRQKTDLNREPWNFNNITLMQYTGMCDVDGKEIYQGDMIGADGKIIDCIWNFLNECKSMLDIPKHTWVVGSLTNKSWHISQRRLLKIGCTFKNDT
jgi:uncharacterized phage protein (TIGR01671 family)